MSAGKSRISPKSKRGTPASGQASISPMATTPVSSPTKVGKSSPGVKEKTVAFRGEGLEDAPEADEVKSTGTDIRTTARTIAGTGTAAATTTTARTSATAITTSTSTNSSTRTTTTTTTSTSAITTTTTISPSATVHFAANKPKDGQPRTLGSSFDSTARDHVFSNALRVTLSKHCKEADSSDQDDFVHELGRLIEKISFTAADMQGFAREVVKQLAHRRQRDPEFAFQLQELRKRLPSGISDEGQEPVESTILKLLEILVKTAEAPKYLFLALVLETLDAELRPADFAKAEVVTPVTERLKKEKKSADKKAEPGEAETESAFLRAIRRLSMPFIALTSPRQKDPIDVESPRLPRQLKQGEEEKASTTESELES